MEIHNTNVLLSLPGEMFTFNAINEGDTADLKCLASKCLRLKPGCKLILMWNKNEKLRNGSSCVFLGVEEDELLVKFDHGQGQVSIERDVEELDM